MFIIVRMMVDVLSIVVIYDLLFVLVVMIVLIIVMLEIVLEFDISGVWSCDGILVMSLKLRKVVSMKMKNKSIRFMVGRVKLFID